MNTAKADNIFYILGFQRSGTTILCHLLDKHPEVSCANEPELSKTIVYGRVDKLEKIENHAINRCIEYHGAFPDEYLNLVGRYRNGELDEHAFLSSAYRLFAKPNSAMAGAKEALEIAAEKFSWLEKLVGIHSGMGVKYVFVERDIKDIVASFLTFGFFPPGKKKLNFRNMKQFVKSYFKIIDNAVALLEKKDVLFKRFEDIAAEPRKELSDIFEFLGVDASDETVAEVAETPSSGSQAEYRGEFGPIRGNRALLPDKWEKWLERRIQSGKL